MVFCFQSCTKEKTCKINIHFKGKVYEKLNLVLRQESEDLPKIIIPGESNNGKDWSFIYNESIFDKHTHTNLVVPDLIDSVEIAIAFNLIIEHDTLKAGSYSFSKGSVDIKATFLRTERFPNILYTNKDNRPAIKTVYQDQFLITPSSDKELLSSIESIGYNYSMFNAIDSTEYNEKLKLYINITRKYPESHTLISKIAMNLSRYNSKQDVEKVYSLFSKENKQSYFGLQIKEFLDTKFENSILPVWNSNSTESLIQDFSKFNLIVFSASWCRPCHEQIPLLKEIYRNLKNNLIITYVSLDEEKDIESWGNLMNKEGIPWRSLLAKDDLKDVKRKYFISGIPHTILVYPKSEITEILDVRREENYNKLIKLVQN